MAEQNPVDFSFFVNVWFCSAKHISHLYLNIRTYIKTTLFEMSILISDLCRPYEAFLTRKETRANFRAYLTHLVNEESRSCAGIARLAGLNRNTIQSFIGQGSIDVERMMSLLRRQVAAAARGLDGVLSIEKHRFHKQGRNYFGAEETADSTPTCPSYEQTGL